MAEFAALRPKTGNCLIDHGDKTKKQKTEKKVS